MAALGLLAFGAGAFGQGQTLSARPGLLNYFEGDVSINGNPLSPSARQTIFLNVGDTMNTGAGKVEVLLMPGVFLRMGDDSRMVMQTPSLVDTRFELLNGEAIVEAMGIMSGSQVSVVNHGAVLTIEKNGLYRIRANGTPTMAVLQGSGEVSFAGSQVKVKRGREVVVAERLKTEKIDTAEQDELYAWSSIRSEYEAAASYQSATTLAARNETAFNGWYYNDMLDSWAWLPNGAFFSPFGWGFYSPVVVSTAVVAECPVMRGGHWKHHPHPGTAGSTSSRGSANDHREWAGSGTLRPVPINQKHPPVMGMVADSPRGEGIVRSNPDPAWRASWIRSAALMQARNNSSATTPVNNAAGKTAPIGRVDRGAGATNGGRPAQTANQAGARSFRGGGPNRTPAGGSSAGPSRTNGSGSAPHTSGAGGYAGGGRSGGGYSGGGTSHASSGGGFSGGGGGHAGGGGGSSSSSGGGSHR
jgi:hypothetical protein